MEGFDIKLLSQETGIGENKVWQILKRHKDLNRMPYSVKAGKNRVFFPAIIEWLAEYEGLSVASVTADKSDRSQLSAAKLREYRLAAQHKLISREQFQQIIGLSAASPVLMIPEVVSKEEAAAREIGRNILLKRARALEDDKNQRRLDGFETIN